MQKKPVGTQSPLKCVAMCCIVKHLWAILGFRENEKMWTFTLGAVWKQKLMLLILGAVLLHDDKKDTSLMKPKLHKMACVSGCSLGNFSTSDFSFYWLFSFATMQPNRKGLTKTLWLALPNLQLEFIFHKSYLPQHFTYPVQSRHWVAWQQLHLRNPAGSQSEAASMQHGDAWTKQVSAGFSYLMTVTHLKG